MPLKSLLKWPKEKECTKLKLCLQLKSPSSKHPNRNKWSRKKKELQIFKRKENPNQELEIIKRDEIIFHKYPILLAKISTIMGLGILVG